MVPPGDAVRARLRRRFVPLTLSALRRLRALRGFSALCDFEWLRVASCASRATRAWFRAASRASRPARSAGVWLRVASLASRGLRASRS